ncbi:MAG: glycosyltransferase family 4 protein [Candidatus Pacebacteria bacterium]|nr:glycosyltransferase family 4 protein [Candidatus Paceibacterota bacterium]
MLQEKPRIAAFSLAFSPFEGGAEVAAREIIKQLPGYSFSIFTYKFDEAWPEKESEANYEIIRVGRGKRENGKYGRILDKIAYVHKAWQEAEKSHKKGNFKAIWAIMASYGGIAALFFKLRHPEIPMLLTVQEGDSERHLIFGKFGLVGFFGKWIIKKADFIQAISNYLKNFAAKRGARCPIKVIPNGVNMELFGKKYSDEELNSLRKNTEITDEYVIVTTSRLVYKNGADILIGAVGILKKRIPNLKCLIIGDGPERHKLEVQSEKLGIKKNVLFLGQMKQEDTVAYLKIADVFVRASRSEGLGNSFLEAMAAGIPVIGTPVGGITDFLSDGKTGLVTEPENHEMLADKILELVRDKHIRKQIVANGQDLIRRNYTWDSIGEKFREIFSKLIK